LPLTWFPDPEPSVKMFGRFLRSVLPVTVLFDACSTSTTPPWNGTFLLVRFRAITLPWIVFPRPPTIAI